MDKKREKHLIDIMRADEESGLYDPGTDALKTLHVLTNSKIVKIDRTKTTVDFGTGQKWTKKELEQIIKKLK